jgi:hypothetical protein
MERDMCAATPRTILRALAAGSLGLLAGTAALLAAGCGGGGGGSAGSNSSSFFLTDVKYGRLVDDGGGPRLVSPLTTVANDPITGTVIPGSLQPLASGVDVDVLQTLGIGPDYLPLVVPRNCVLQLEFSAPVAAASLVADTLDAQGNVLAPGSVQVRTGTGKGVRVVLSRPSANVVWVDPIVGSSVGFPPSPVDFGPDGAPRADTTGFLKLVLPTGGAATIVSTRGATLGRRHDGIGEPATPVGFNPGNRVLDFIAQNHLIPTGETFNGFLPDIAPPRILRTHAYSKALDFASGDAATATTITDAAATFSTTARNGQGEWAGARLVLRPGLPAEETHVVLSDTSTVVTIADSFVQLPADGDEYRLERAEFFEPDPANPIDPASFDPNDPENANNGDFARFVEALEVDGDGNVIGPPRPMSDPLPPFSILRVHFNEPMAAESLGAYENFQARFDPDQGAGSELLSQVVLDDTHMVASLRPALVDPATGSARIVGWGKGVKPLQFQLSIVPKIEYLQLHMNTPELDDFLDLGFRGITDLGGQPVAFPDSIFDAADPLLTFTAKFTSDESRSTQQPPPVVESWGVIVHRMQGRPKTGVDPATGVPGVKYVDQANYYVPIADVNLQANGYLAGSPVVYVQKIHDDFFPPPYGQYGAFPLGAAYPLASFNTVGGAQPHDGARFQTVYRDQDCSPSRDALAGTLLDLYRLSWAPIGGNVTTDAYDNISVHCAHSTYRPMTTQNGAGADFPLSGLTSPFDYSTWEALVKTNTKPCTADCSYAEGPNYWDTLVPVVPPGTPYKITQGSLFTPPFDDHPYCPWPTFTTIFQYNNGDIPAQEKLLRKAINDNYTCFGAPPWLDRRKYDSRPDYDNLGGDSLLVEYRIRPQTTNISRANGFTFSIGILIVQTPNFRVFSVGSPGMTMNPDDMTVQESRCAIGNNSAPSNSNNGDNDRYFAAFDYVKTTSIITSPFVRVYPSTTSSPDFQPAIVSPAPSDQPEGTQVKLEFQGANNNKGAGATDLSTDVNIADGKGNLAFRATFVGNVTTLLLPNFDLIEIPYLRPLGD